MWQVDIVMILDPKIVLNYPQPIFEITEGGT